MAFGKDFQDFDRISQIFLINAGQNLLKLPRQATIQVGAVIGGKDAAGRNVECRHDLRRYSHRRHLESAFNFTQIFTGDSSGSGDRFLALVPVPPRASDELRECLTRAFPSPFFLKSVSAS